MLVLTRLSRTALLRTFYVSCLVAMNISQLHARATQHSTAEATGLKDHGKNAKSNDLPLSPSAVRNPVLWHQPGKISELDLYYGQGGQTRQPAGPFMFEAEDMNGTNAKMDVRDASGKKWRVKGGEEARPEVAASRLLWAVGYYANDDYLLKTATVSGVQMKRGTDDFKRGKLTDVRFSRKPAGQDKIAIWEWRSNPFSGTREFNGLRVMMAVLNDWDLKDVNNSVYSDKATGSQVFLVSDVGATFGTNGISFSKAKSKGNADSFKDSEFVEHLTETSVSFSTPKKPTGILFATGGATAKSYKMRSELDWIGNDIPRADARWIGSLLGQLTHQQLTDAFRASNFSEADAATYVQVLEGRIAELKKL